MKNKLTYLCLPICINFILFSSFHVSDSWSYPSKKTSNQNSSDDQKSKTKDADKRIKNAFDREQSDFWVQSQGVVVKIFKDDTEGAHHQRFLLRLSNGHSFLISHNIDIAPRIDGIKPGDTVTFNGEYEWNNKGGVIHWTHHDPSKSKTGGWLMHQGKKYE